MAERLLSPLGRRIVRKAELDPNTVGKLLQLGWVDYDGPGRATYSKDKRLTGWVVPDTDPTVDACRLARTGTLQLGPGPRAVK